MRKTVVNILYNAIYQVLLVVMPLVTVPYLGSVLGPKNLGIYSTVNYVIQFLTVFCSAAMGQIGTRTIAQKRGRSSKAEFSEAFWGLWFIQAAASLGTIILFLVVIFIWQPDYKMYFILQLPFLLGTLFDISWFFQGIADFGRVVLRNTIVKVLGVILILLLVKNGDDLWKYMLIMSMTMFIGSLAFWPLVRHEVKTPTWHFYQLKDSLMTIGILLIPQLATSVYTSLDKPILKMFRGATQVGYYDYAQRVSNIILGVITSITIVMMPKMASSSDEDQEKYLKKSFETTLFLGLILAIIVMINTRQFVPWFFTSKFIPIIPLMFFSCLSILSIPLGGVFANQFALAKHRDKEFAIPLVIGAVLSLILNFKFDPIGGAYAAMANILIVEAVVCFLRIWIVRKDYSAKYVFSDTWKYLLIGVVTFGIGILLPNIISNTFFNMAYKSIVVFIIYMGLFILIKVDIIQDIKKMISSFRKRGKA